MKRNNIASRGPWENCGSIRPYTGVVQVNRLIVPEMLVEIEAETDVR